jgi:large subunit ribosomal protein L18
MKRVNFRRKREGKTNYKKRLSLLLSKKPRLIINKSLKNINLQIANYSDNGDIVVVSANSKELEKKFDWKFSKTNLSACYLTGYLLGKKAIKKNIKQAILDIGLATSVKGSRLYASLKGAIDAGLNVPVGNDIFPSEDSIKGIHIQKYAELLKKENKYEKTFSSYIKKGIDATNLPNVFEETKTKIDQHD